MQREKLISSLSIDRLKSYEILARTGEDDRRNITKRFEEIKLIRNRLFHHEPIWKFKYSLTPQDCIAELRRKFNDIFKAIGWISNYKRNLLRELGFVEMFKRNCTLDDLETYKILGNKIVVRLEQEK